MKPLHTKLSKLFATTLLFTPCITHAELRPLAADRPDATESPQTVDKGHFQIETTFLGATKDKTDGVTTESFYAFETNLKYGLTESIDLQFVIAPYIDEKIKTATSYIETQTHGDIAIRSKINLWGNDSGDTAFALLPYIKLPYGDLSNDKHEMGLIMTYGTSYQDYGVGIQFQVDRLYNEVKDVMDWAGSHTAVLGYDLTHGMGGYLEYIGEINLETDYIPYVSLGFTKQTSQNTQWDIGSKFGLVNQAQDSEIFLGVTHRY